MNKKLYNLLIVVFAAVFLISGGFLGVYYYNSYVQQSRYNELAAMKGQETTPRPEPTAEQTEQTDSTEATTEATEPSGPVLVYATNKQTGETRMVLPEYAALFELNSDIVGWMKIPGTVVDYPVMQTSSDQDYYLYRNFDKEDSKQGCLLVQAQANVFEPSDNVTVHGHHMRDGTMFGQLEKYQKKSFRDENPYIYFDTLTELHTYEIMSVFITTVSVGKGFPYYAFVDAQDPEEFDEFVQTCKKLDLYETGVQAQYGDKLLCLSTCEYSRDNGRLVVVAKRIA